MEEAENSSKDVAAGESSGKLKRLFLLVQWTVNLIVLGVIVYVFTPLGGMAQDELTMQDDLRRADYIVVLGGDYERLAEAANLYENGWAEKVIVTSKGEDANLMANVLEHYGVPKDSIIIDDKAQRTLHHPRTVADLPGVDPGRDSFIVVTSRYHTSRSYASFNRAGYKHLIMRYPYWETVRPEEWNFWKRLSDLPMVIYEVLAWGMYKVRGWI